MAQRLVRRLCLQCRAEVEAEAVPEADRVALDEATVYEAKGCGACRGTGYRGRLGIFEIFTLNDEIRHQVLAGAHAREIQREALREGMRTLRESGLAAVRRGVTSLSEVYRVARDSGVSLRSEQKGESC